jgi:hypothetical protein
MKLLSFLLVLWFCACCGFAQNNPAQVRSFDEKKLEKIRQNPNFNYEEDIETYSQHDTDWEYKRWRWEEEQRKKMEKDANWEIKKVRPQEGLNLDLNFSLGKSAIYIASAIVIIFLLLALLGIDIRSLLQANKNIVEKTEDQDWQDLHENNLDTLIEQAIGKEQYNLAIRYAFLKSLQLLAQKNYIQLQKEKTNAEYQKELNQSKKDLLKDFTWQSRIFAYIKYGEFEINKNQFDSIYPKFKSFYQNF